jgi:hypothetical protein
MAFLNTVIRFIAIGLITHTITKQLFLIKVMTIATIISADLIIFLKVRSSLLEHIKAFNCVAA